MSRKRRIFDIDLPEEPEAPAAAPEPVADAGAARRGPMASAIAENAEALKARRSTVEAIREENDALAHEYVALRDAGHVVKPVPLDQVHTYMLVRDRIPGEDEELAELMTSIRELGLSNPIRVMPRPDGTGYELVQGFRRLSAYRQLHEETGDAAWGEIPSLVMPGEPDVAGLYRRMVDENVIRKDLSFAEMAYAAQNYAAEPSTEAEDVGEAVAALFQSAPYSKRNYIRNFAFLLERLGQDLAYPTAIPRALGVALAREIKERPEIVGQIRDALTDWEGRSIRDELDVLRRFTGQGDPEEDAAPVPRAKTSGGTGGRTKTTFHIQSSAGQVKCTAGPGRLEIRVERDFSSIERARLERAIASLIDGLG
ncbi:replication protein, putative [Pseudooceanicola batsensis HTCC2597]|uniref:Replication protein, putative n=1 Tax=Pseudooceanicola batsensis (strain ATCC BAA-863 / DSM 15984 / KCTC 12145 / HTCC2597) TaxID=252305 RepID=A3U0Q2_PSEBH|nr:ParB N-terminal domain-containing protein [Pseudooceanicola batsensis]EAQ02343.1 replication protein, putative [Pseudooceanicola batsensis HTCC2597]